MAKLKIYTSGCGRASRTALRSAGAPGYTTQGDVYVVATSKVKAGEHGQVLHVGHWAASDWSEASGDDVDAIRAAGYLATDGEAVVLRSDTVADYVAHARVSDDDTDWIPRLWTRVGRLVRPHVEGRGNVTILQNDPEPPPVGAPTRFYAVVELDPGTSAGERIALENRPTVTLVHEGVHLAYGTVVRVEQR